MGIESATFENQDRAPKHNVVIVDLLRHGSTKYQENFATAEEKAEMNGNYPRDLTPEGEQEIRDTAEKIVDSIDPDNDIVVLWGSPAWRAQGSEEILSEMLEQKNITVYKDSEIGSMRNFDQHDREYMNKLWESLAPINKSAELMYAKEPEFQEKNDKFESQPEVKKRAGRVLNYIHQLAKKVHLDGKRLRIIGVSHFEFLNPIIEDIYGPKVESGDGVKKGEDLQITFDYDPQENEMTITSNFRGEHKEGIAFNSEKRILGIE